MSAEALELASKWLRKCMDEHPECPSANPKYFPKRVVDVGQDIPRLIEEPHVAVGPYVALSYCWGPDPHTQLKTKSDNLEAHKQRIPLSTMPLTLKHAIHVTRQLGFQYLWIDALCIIQDSTLDWEEQAARMQDIYEGAAITIAADAGSNSAAAEDHATLRNGNSILQARAWAFQEQMLSKRVLHFGEFEMGWECAICTRCECGADNWTNSGSNKKYGTYQKRSTYKSSDTLSWNWIRAIQNYSKRALTVPSDRLPALSGLASRAAHAHSATYLAGLWTEDLALGLLWRRSDGGVGTRPAEYIAPSWSWASIQGAGVDWGLGLSARSWVTFDLQDVSCTPRTAENPFGAVTDG
ncbi:heterokaryon incompatibility protein-domain-containing protein [Apiosordaria backusii]|uniref:Heterokaryon incompatibility protein-domain-containing protein n=1 Tax=Apiosordaria backusii TaxID=314023 RepID=A0AA40DWY9_9PEZI|nr:heterokaryon incompatibility protein-domain-containing protein [Apiosordaria backusii]